MIEALDAIDDPRFRPLIESWKRVAPRVGAAHRSSPYVWGQLENKIAVHGARIIEPQVY